MRSLLVALLLCLTASAALAQPRLSRGVVYTDGTNSVKIDEGGAVLINGDTVAVKPEIADFASYVGLRTNTGDYAFQAGDEARVVVAGGSGEDEYSLPSTSGTFETGDILTLVTDDAFTGTVTVSGEPGVDVTPTETVLDAAGRSAVFIVTAADEYLALSTGGGASAIGSEDPGDPSGSAALSTLYYVARTGSAVQPDSVFYWASVDSLAYVVKAASLPGSVQLNAAPAATFSTLVFSDDFSETSGNIVGTAPETVPSGGDASWSASTTAPTDALVHPGAGQVHDGDGSGGRAGFIDLGTLAASWRLRVFVDMESNTNSGYDYAVCVGGAVGTEASGLCLTLEPTGGASANLYLGTTFEGASIASQSFSETLGGTDAANYRLELEVDGGTATGRIYDANDLVTPLAIVTGSAPTLTDTGLWLHADSGGNGFFQPLEIYE